MSNTIEGKSPMLSFTPTQKLENELRQLQNDIVEKYKELESLSEIEVEYLQRMAFISNIGASTRIENAVLTNPEIDWIDTTLSTDGKPTAFDMKKEFILDKLSKDRERSVEEVVGCREVLSTIYLQANELFPLAETTVRGLHHNLLQYCPYAARFAGEYKTSSNRVIYLNRRTGEERIVLEPAPPGILTNTAMTDLVQWYNVAITAPIWPLVVATEFEFRFLAIHPFQDGNGRLGRALFILALLQSNDKYYRQLVPYIAIDRHIEQNRNLYYTVLHQCSQGKFHSDPTLYHFEPLAWFFIKVLKNSLSDVDVYRTRYSNFQKLSESALSVLNSFKASPEKRLRVSEVTKTTCLPRRTVQYALNTLIKKQFLQKLGQGAGTRYQLVF
jgi:Fic family protein